MKFRISETQNIKISESQKLRNSETQKFWILLLLLILTVSANCQTVESLEKKIQSIQKDIKLAEKLLKETSKNKEATINQVSLLQTQIKQREDLIKTYQNQVNALNKDIQKNKNGIAAAKKDLQLFQKEYANLLVIAYRNKGKTNNLMFIFSSEDFNQAVRRMRLKQARAYSEEKIDAIMAAQVSEEVYRNGCQKVIDNSGSFEETKAQLKEILE